MEEFAKALFDARYHVSVGVLPVLLFKCIRGSKLQCQMLRFRWLRKGWKQQTVRVTAEALAKASDEQLQSCAATLQPSVSKGSGICVGVSCSAWPACHFYFCTGRKFRSARLAEVSIDHAVCQDLSGRRRAITFTLTQWVSLQRSPP